MHDNITLITFHTITITTFDVMTHNSMYLKLLFVIDITSSLLATLCYFTTCCIEFCKPEFKLFAVLVTVFH